MSLKLATAIPVVMMAGLGIAPGAEDGILLDLEHGATPGSAHLTWSGAPPNYSVYRAPYPAPVSPPNQIGFTGFASWDEDLVPAVGEFLYYEVTASCTPSPLEICDGLDNDCDGGVDGRGSEASCSLPNATPQCVAGICAVGSCDAGWGDCNTDAGDGCEASLNAAQSTSPSAYGGAGDEDLQPGYIRVASITNCGGCGVTCDDGLPCTTDLCVPSAAGLGQCSDFDRDQCAGARCDQPMLPPGTPPPTEPGCAGVDADGDGLSSPWEEPQVNPYTGEIMAPGIDLDCDGVISGGSGDLPWHEPPMGDSTKDVYLEYDYMAAEPGETGSHAPSPAAISDVVSAFAAAGVALHVDPNQQTVPHAPVVYIPVTGPVDECAAIPGAVSLYDAAYKGDPSVFEQKRNFGYHYFLFGHNSSCEGDTSPKTSGMAEVKGNDAIVSLGDFTYLGTSAEIDFKKRREEAGTMMHELGHNLRLFHGGPVDSNGPIDPNDDSALEKKPNHMSVMNYSHQFNGIQRAAVPGQIVPPDAVMPRRLDFSHEELNQLDETFLDEFTGIDATMPPFDRDIVRHYCLSRPGPQQAPATGPIDWDCDGFMDFPVSEDVNADGLLGTLLGASEWDNLFYGFQCQPTLADGAQEPFRIARTELTLERAVEEGLRAGPLTCDPGTSDCDGDDTNGCETPGFCSTAPTCSPDSIWSSPLGFGPASAAVSDTEFNPTGSSFSYLSNGSTVYSVYNVSESGNPAGTIRWTRPFPSAIENFPNPVLLKDGSESVFVAGTGGFLFRLDAETGMDEYPPVNTKRPTCPLDQIIATPAVQLRNYSNGAFQSAQSDDLVFVITRTGCGDTTSNRVLAFQAATGAMAWTFNPTPLGLTMNYGSEGCSIDYGNNILYCGTEQVGAQHTLWAISTLDGTRVWSTNAGAILNRPMLRSSRVYVATFAGILKSFDAATGTPIWSTVVTGFNIEESPAVVSGGPFDGLILVNDTAGTLRAFLDMGSSGGPVWVSRNPGPTQYVGLPVVAPSLGKAYVGRSDGYLQQIDLKTGAAEATATVGVGTVSDPSFDIEGGADINRLMAAAGSPVGDSQLRRFCIPWVPGSAGTH